MHMPSPPSQSTPCTLRCRPLETYHTLAAFFFFLLAATVVDSGKAALNMYTYISASVLDHFFHFCSPVTDFFIFPFFSLSLLFFLRFSVDCQSPYSSHFILFLPPLLSFFCIFPFLVRLQ